jgi:DNA repair photolyase
MRPVANPPNPWLSTSVEYLEEPPVARLEVIEDSTKGILSHNDSPDLGFRWSVNPYRGCWHACAYCLDGDTPILRADGRHAPLRSLRPGDEIYGTVRSGMYRRYVATTVLDIWQTVKPAYRIHLDDGSHLVASGDHRFLTRRGWKYVVGTESGAARRPHLTPNDFVLGTGGFSPTPSETEAYRVGYLAGMVRRGGLLGHHHYPRRRGGGAEQWQFRLALVDLEPLWRTRSYLDRLSVETRVFEFTVASERRKRLWGIRSHARRTHAVLSQLVELPEAPSTEWSRGFLAGMFDAEGSWSRGLLRFSNTDAELLAAVRQALERFDFDAVLEPGGPGRASNVRVRGGLSEHLRFFHLTDPCIRRKRDLRGVALKSPVGRRVRRVEALGVDLLMFDLSTGTEDFIANGVVSHNCYARPRHEYLSLGAGTDFERKLVVKPRAPELLREAFEKPSWRGELVLFSGDTDCYQPLEASYGLTRGCLTVMAEYKNPCGVITKSPLIERDVDLLVELARVADLSLTISIPFWDPERARAMEPYVATPQRRIKTIERLAKAGLRVGVNIAPLIPGLGDEDMPTILEAARDAGAVRAGFVFLRLPGPVAVVFEERLRRSLPLRAERVLARVREARGGKLYDGRFGARQKGEGHYAEAALALFEATTRRLGLETFAMGPPPPERHTFERPLASVRGDGPGVQLSLFSRPR